MSHSHHAFGMNFVLFGFQTKINQCTLWKWRVGLYVAAAQTQIGQLAVRDRLINTGSSCRASCRL